MLHTDQAIARIRAYVKAHKGAKFRLAVNAGVPEGCTRGADTSKWNPTARILRKIEAAVPDNFILPPNNDDSHE